jgi:hypothetical protein
MKALYITSSFSPTEVALLGRVQQELGPQITVLDINTITGPLKSVIRTTPALIVVTDDLQGDNILAEGTDGQLIITAILNKRLSEEEAAVHNQETNRLDNLIANEKQEAIDAYTLELLNGGKITQAEYDYITADKSSN